MPNETRKVHHFLQRAYLARFAGPDGLVWQHDLEMLESKRVHPNVAGSEKYLYAPEVGPDPKDDSIEVELAERVDGPGIAAIAALSEGTQLTDEQRFAVALYLAVQERRIPRARDAMAASMRDMASKVLKLVAAHPDYIKHTLLDMGRPATEEDVSRMARTLAKDTPAVEPTKVAWLTAVSDSGDTAETIYNLPWVMVRTPPSFELLTSDAPVVKVLTDRSVPAMFSGGWLSPSAETTFALDPEHLLVIRPDGFTGKVDLVPVWFRDVNRRTIGQANRFVYSRSNESYIGTIMGKVDRDRKARIGRSRRRSRSPGRSLVIHSSVGMKVVMVESTAEDWLKRLDRGPPGPLIPGVLIYAF